MLHIPYSHHAYLSELLPPFCQFSHRTSHETEVGCSERTFRHDPEARHCTGDKRGMKVWQVPGMQNKTWLHTGELMLFTFTKGSPSLQHLPYIYVQRAIDECNHIGHFKMRKDLRFPWNSNTIDTPLRFTAMLMKLM